MVPFPFPGHRTGRADFPHLALRPASRHTHDTPSSCCRRACSVALAGSALYVALTIIGAKRATSSGFYRCGGRPWQRRRAPRELRSAPHRGPADGESSTPGSGNFSRTQSRLSPVGDARAPPTLPHPLARVVLNLGGLTQGHGDFDPSNWGGDPRRFPARGVNFWRSSRPLANPLQRSRSRQRLVIPLPLKIPCANLGARRVEAGKL
jgi:hypothetical protein